MHLGRRDAGNLIARALDDGVLYYRSTTVLISLDIVVRVMDKYASISQAFTSTLFG